MCVLGGHLFYVCVRDYRGLVWGLSKIRGFAHGDYCLIDFRLLSSVYLYQKTDTPPVNSKYLRMSGPNHRTSQPSKSPN